jgi:negative regulator of sigma E activity
MIDDFGFRKRIQQYRQWKQKTLQQLKIMDKINYEILQRGNLVFVS